MPLFHACNLRRGRFSESGLTYLVTAVTCGREPVFADFGLGRALVGELRNAEEQQLVRSLCWVVMPDHLHWLLELADLPLDAVIRQVKSRSAKQVNRLRCSSGAVWQKGYHDHALRQDEDRLNVARYVVANPLRAGLVTRLGDYPLWDAAWL